MTKSPDTRKVYAYSGKVEVTYMGSTSTWIGKFAGETTASSPAQAKTFLAYQAKMYGLSKHYTLNKGARLSLPGSLIER